MSDRRPATPAPCSCAADAVRPADFGWVLDGWVKLLLEWERADKLLAAARTPEARSHARWRLDEAAGALWKYKDETARGVLWAVRHAAELQATELRAVLSPLVAQTAAEQTDPAVAALRGRVAALERLVEVLAERVENLTAVVLSNISGQPNG